MNTDLEPVVFNRLSFITDYADEWIAQMSVIADDTDKKQSQITRINGLRRCHLIMEDTDKKQSQITRLMDCADVI